MTSRILGIGKSLPPHYYDQETLIEAFLDYWKERGTVNGDRLRSFHRHAMVGGRHLALPIDQYPQLEGFAAANAAWRRVAVELAEQATRQALERSALPIEAIGQILFTSVTGLATPSIDALLMNRLSFSPDTKRVPIFGLGCVAGAAGLARAHDYTLAYPDRAALLISVELCSLTLQREDLTAANLIASGLFGDGAAAVIVAGEKLAGGRGLQIVESESVFYNDTEELMGWRMSDTGFGVVLSPKVPGVALEFLPGDVDRFLSRRGLRREQIARWVCHSGGPKVLEAMQQGLRLPPGALDLSWRSLRDLGNLSSASVLMVLDDTCREAPGAPGEYGLLMAMGPGFCSELVLLRW